MMSIVTDLTCVRKNTHSLVKLTPQQRLAFIRLMLSQYYKLPICSHYTQRISRAGAEDNKVLFEQDVLSFKFDARSMIDYVQ